MPYITPKYTEEINAITGRTSLRVTDTFYLTDSLISANSSHHLTVNNYYIVVTEYLDYDTVKIFTSLDYFKDYILRNNNYDRVLVLKKSSYNKLMVSKSIDLKNVSKWLIEKSRVEQQFNAAMTELFVELM